MDGRACAQAWQLRGMSMYIQLNVQPSCEQAVLPTSHGLVVKAAAPYSVVSMFCVDVGQGLGRQCCVSVRQDLGQCCPEALGEWFGGLFFFYADVLPEHGAAAVQVLLKAVRKLLQVPFARASDGTFVEVASLSQIYKVFERC